MAIPAFAPQIAALPHNLDAEQGVLGALLMDNAVAEALGDLQADHFFDPVHGRIYGLIQRQLAAGRAVDAVSLREHMLAEDGLEAIGGGAYLLTLLSRAARITAYAAEYAEVIRDGARKRGLIRVCHGGLAAAADASQPAADAIAETERALRQIDLGGAAFVTLSQAAASVVEGLRSPVVPGLRTGIAGIDTLIGGLYPGDLVVLAGRPSMGKTSLATNIAFNVATDANVVLFVSAEMTAAALAERQIARLSFGGPAAFAYRALRSTDRRPNPDHAAALAQRLPWMAIDESGGQTVAKVAAQARNVRRARGKIDLVVVDYIQLLTDANKSRDRVQEVSAISAGLKSLAKDLHCPVLALSQLSRGPEQREDKRPQLSDLRESGAIEQDADVVLFAYRQHYYLSRKKPQPEEGEHDNDFAVRKRKWMEQCQRTAGVFELICAKARMGATGTAELQCELAHDFITDPEPEQAQAYAPAYGGMRRRDLED